MFTSEQVQELWNGYLTVSKTYYRLMLACQAFATENVKSCEYVLHGFLRRLGTLQRCIENVYSIYPPERSDIPSRNECIDLAINLQSFIFNVFGCIDNLAWIWVKEKQVNDSRGRLLRDQQIG